MKRLWLVPAAALVLVALLPNAALAATKYKLSVMGPSATSVSYTTAGSGVFSGTATGKGISKVTVQVNGARRVVSAKLRRKGTRYTWKTGALGLRAGTNTVLVSVKVGKKTKLKKTVKVIVDRTPPVVSLTAPANGSISDDGMPLLTYTVDDASAEVAVAIDGAAVTTRSGGRLGPLQDGPHTVSVTAKDLAGNIGSAQSAFTADTSAFVVNAISIAGTYGAAQLVTLSSTRPGSVIYYTIDGSPPTPLSVTYVAPVAVTSSLTLRAIAVDALGYVSPTLVASYVIDTVPPSVKVLHPADGSIVASAAPRLSYSATDGETAVSIVGVTVDGTAVATRDGEYLSTVAQGHHELKVSATDGVGNIASDTSSFTVDTVPPTGSMVLARGATVTSSTTLAVQSLITGAVQMRFDAGGGWGSWLLLAEDTLLALSPGDGIKTVKAEYRDAVGNVLPLSASIGLDTQPPSGTMRVDGGRSATNARTITVDSSVADAIDMRVNSGNGWTDWRSYAPSVPGSLTAGDGFKTVQAEYRDHVGNTALLSASITLDTIAPTPVSAAIVADVLAVKFSETLEAASIPDASSLAVHVAGAASAPTSVDVTDDSIVLHLASAAKAGDVVLVDYVPPAGDKLQDPAGNAADGFSDRAVTNNTAEPPPAGEIDPTVATDIVQSAKFLFDATNPLQTGVTGGTLDDKRLALLRGHVHNRDGLPIVDAEITILGHPEFGQTKTQVDGGFTIAVNGGGPLTVDYRHDGYLPIQRTLDDAPWAQWVSVPDVVLVPLDSKSTRLDLGPSLGLTVARGNTTSDADGARTPTMIFAPGTSAEMTLPNGTVQTLGSVDVRATEYTVGASGRAAMPGELPPGADYTYAVELSLDQAVTAGAESVRFTKPVIQYVENFLGVPVGAVVPVGYYDRESGQWVASENGRVIEIVSITGGMADVAVDSAGTASPAERLQAFGITDDERAQLALLYPSGTTLWRYRVTHFSAYDCNWPFRPPTGARPPVLPPFVWKPPVKPCPDPLRGSIIGVQDQTLGEEQSIFGTEFSLHYQTERTGGYTPTRSITLPLGDDIPPGCVGIDVEIDVAGEHVERHFPPTRGQTFSYTWDAQDGLGRPVYGSETANVSVGYTYVAKRQPVNSFASPDWQDSDGMTWTSESDDRATITLWTEFTQLFAGTPPASASSIGAWSLSVNHFYDAENQTLYLGDGTKSTGVQKFDQWTIDTIAGSTLPTDGANADARMTALSEPIGLAKDPDGHLLVAEQGRNRVSRIETDGILTRIAGRVATMETASSGYAGDGGPATLAAVNGPEMIACAADGTLYIADTVNSRIRRVDPNGTVRTIAGTDTLTYDPDADTWLRESFGFSGDGGPAIAAALNEPRGVALGTGGRLYITDTGNNRVRCITPDGNIDTVAGGGVAPEDGVELPGPATLAYLQQPTGIAFAPDGKWYISELGVGVVRRVDRFGGISIFAGGGTETGGDVEAHAAQLGGPVSLSVGPDGSVYIAESTAHRVSRVSPSGLLTIAVGAENRDEWGTLLGGFAGDGGQAKDALLDGPSQVLVDAAGSIYISDFYNNVIRKVDSAGIIQTIAGIYDGYHGDGLLATRAILDAPTGLDFGPDGTLYASDYDMDVVRAVDPSGVIRPIAGTGSRGFSEDGIPATSAQLLGPHRIAIGPDGSVYIAETDAQRIRRVGTDGIIRTIAGTGTPNIFGDVRGGYSGDGGPAVMARLNAPLGVDVGPDGSVYIADTMNHRIRKIGTDGIIRTVVGTATPDQFGVDRGGFSGDGGPAVRAEIDEPSDVCVLPDGGLYFTDSANSRIRQVSASGVIGTVAGGGSEPAVGQGSIVATSADLFLPGSVRTSPDGGFYLADSSWNFFGGHGEYTVKHVSPDAQLSVIAGDGEAGFRGDKGPAGYARLNHPRGLAVSPGGEIYIADASNGRVRKLSRYSNRIQGDSGEVFIPSDDGSQVFVFKKGKHQRTVSTLSSTVIYSFAYDPNGLLVSVTDRNGRVTTIVRDASGNPTDIISPDGLHNRITTDANGRIATISCPLNNPASFSYSSAGLMTSFRDRKGQDHTFDFDSQGRLISDLSPGGGSLSLSRISSGVNWKVIARTAEGQVTTYTTEFVGSAMRNSVDRGDGTRSVRVSQDTSWTELRADGTSVKGEMGPDPVWGWVRPRTVKTTIKTPGGRSVTALSGATADLAVPGDPLSVRSLVETTSVEGHVYTNIFDFEARRLRTISPEGRETTTTFDDFDRFTTREKPALATEYSAYDSVGRLSSVHMGSLGTTLTYDSLSRPVTEEYAPGRTVERTFNGANILTSTSSGGRTYEYGYDLNGQLTSVTNPNGAKHLYGWSPSGINTTYTAPAEQVFGSTFDRDGRMLRKTRPSGSTVDFNYGSDGLLSDISEQGDIARFVRAQPGSIWTTVSRETSGAPSQNIDFHWDGSLMTRATWSGATDGDYTFRYDALNLLAGVRLDSGSELAISRDRDGYVTGVGPFTMTRNGPNAAPTAITDGTFDELETYSPEGGLTRLQQRVSGSTKYDLQLARDANGQISGRTERVDGVTHVYSYAYDATGRLLSVSRDGGSPVETYAYDANGNRTQRSLNGGPSESSTYDSNDRMLTSGSTVVSVSVDGCVTALGDTKFNYGARMMLKGITLPSGDTIRYGYDAFNRLTSRTATAGTTQFLYGNPYNIAEVTHSRDENGVTTAYFYRPTSGIYAMKRGGVLYYISTDQVGTPRLVTDGAGNVVKRIERDSFGRLLSDSNPSFKLVFGFAGGLDEPATGIVRFGLRDYDPTTGRWLEPDPLKSDSGDGDFYAYCTNDPIGLRDPLGLEGAQLNFSAYDVIGAQGQVTITDKGIGACIGGGVGIGGGVDGTVGSEVTLPAEGMTLFAELSQSMGPVTGKIGVSIGDVFDPCSTSKLQVSARSGPLQARATIDNHMGTKLDPRFRMELPQFRGPRIDMAGGVKAEAKLGIQYCTFMLF